MKIIDFIGSLSLDYFKPQINKMEQLFAQMIKDQDLPGLFGKFGKPKPNSEQSKGEFPQIAQLMLRNLFSKMSHGELQKFIEVQEKMIAFGKKELESKAAKEEEEAFFKMLQNIEKKEEQKELSTEKEDWCENCGTYHQFFAFKKEPKVVKEHPICENCGFRHPKLSDMRNETEEFIVLNGKSLSNNLEGDSLPWPKVSKDELDQELEEIVKARNTHLELSQLLDF